MHLCWYAAFKVENIPAFIAGVKAKKEKLFGFGHRVYRNFDPRANIIKSLAPEVFAITGHDPLIEVGAGGGGGKGREVIIC